MTPTSTRTELEESILTCCKSLFLTSAIPELIKQDKTGWYSKADRIPCYRSAKGNHSP